MRKPFPVNMRVFCFRDWLSEPPLRTVHQAGGGIQGYPSATPRRSILFQSFRGRSPPIHIWRNPSEALLSQKENSNPEFFPRGSNKTFVRYSDSSVI